MFDIPEKMKNGTEKLRRETQLCDEINNLSIENTKKVKSKSFSKDDAMKFYAKCIEYVNEISIEKYDAMVKSLFPQLDTTKKDEAEILNIMNLVSVIERAFNFAEIDTDGKDDKAIYQMVKSYLDNQPQIA